MGRLLTQPARGPNGCAAIYFAGASTLGFSKSVFRLSQSWKNSNAFLDFRESVPALTRLLLFPRSRLLRTYRDGRFTVAIPDGK